MLKITNTLILSLLICFTAFSKIQPEAEKGKLDLTKWNFKKDGIINLSGEWEFYWNKLIQPEHFHLLPQKMTGYIKMPSYWINQTINGQTFPSYGCATYRLIVMTKHYEDAEFSAHLKEMFSSYSLFVNGKLVATNGQVAETKEKNIPEYIPQTVPLYLNSTENEIILQIANFTHLRGGQLNAIEIGQYRQINEKRNKNIAFDLFMFGSFFIIAIYHFALFALRKKDKSALYFGLYTLIMAIRTIATGEQFLSVVFPNIPWEISYKFDYLVMFLAPSLLITFFLILFPKESWKPFNYTFNTISIASALFALIFPMRYITVIEGPYQILMFIGMVYGMIVLIKGIINKKEGSVIILIGILVVFATVTNDILYYQSIIQSTELVPYGMMLFIFSQAYVISMRFSKSFIKTEELTEELNYQNKNLEKIVETRTQEITQQKEEIITQSEQLEKTNLELQEKNRVVTDSITYAKDIQEAIFPSNLVLTKYFPQHFVFFRPRDIVSGDFYWFYKIENRKFIAVIDCTGHGVPGAFMSMIGNTLLNNIVKEQKVYEPSEILSKLDKEILYSLKQNGSTQDDGMDITLCCIDEQKKVVQIAMANHKVIIVKHGEIQIFTGSIFSIGDTLTLSNDVKFTNFEISLDEDLFLYMFSDGIVDQFGGEEDNKFGFEKLETLIKYMSTEDFCEQYKILIETTDKWKGTNKQTDDMLLIGIKINAIS